MKVALLISTYNWPEALDLVLESVLLQTAMPDEVLIADDGSDERTRHIIEKYTAMKPGLFRHFWHEDLGFRKAAILNKAIAACSADYIIQVDGDCFLHPSFVEDHKEEAEKGQYLYGTRVRIKEKKVPEILTGRKLNIHFFTGGLRKRPRSLRIPIAVKLFRPQASISEKFRGCNTSFWREDCLDVNGYNEALEGWGREDSELMIRLHHKGVMGKRLKFKALVYHLDHFERSKDQLDNNTMIQDTTIAQKLVRCENGIDKYL